MAFGGGLLQYSLTKLMVSDDLPRSTITTEIAFDQRDLYSTAEFDLPKLILLAPAKMYA